MRYPDPNSVHYSELESEPAHVTIVMRTRNRPVLLARALASVLSQTHQAWHLRLVNDGGEQGPVADLIATYATAFGPRLTLIEHPKPRGRGASFNAALASSAGDFVATHDDDDSWHPDFLRKCVSFLRRPENDRFAAVATNTMIVHEKVIGDIVLEESREGWLYWRKHIDFANMLVWNMFPSISLLMRREIADQLGGLNSALPVLAEWDQNIRLLSLGDIGAIDEYLAYHHHRKDAFGQASYANAIGPGGEDTRLQEVLYRNSAIRRIAASSPENLSLLQVVLKSLEDQSQAVQIKASREHAVIHDHIGLVERGLHERNSREHAVIHDHIVLVERELHARLDRIHKIALRSERRASAVLFAANFILWPFRKLARLVSRMRKRFRQR